MTIISNILTLIDGLAYDRMLPIDELRFNSDRLKADTDEDGLNDSEEYAAGYIYLRRSNNPDTDNDKKLDGNDSTPLCDFSEHITKFSNTPDMDSANFSYWTKLASKPSFQKDDELTLYFTQDGMTIIYILAQFQTKI